MKGLFLKDLYNLKRLLKQYLLILAFMLIWSYMIENLMFAVIYIVMCSVMAVLSSMSYDEFVNFNKYALTLPVTKKDLVRSKYLLLLSLFGAGLISGILCSLGLGILKQVEGSELIEQMIGVLPVSFLFLVVFSILLPIVFKMGVEKSRMILVGIYIAMFALAYVMFTVFKRLNWWASFDEHTWMLLMFVSGPLLAVVTIAITYQISVRIVEHKEW